VAHGTFDLDKIQAVAEAQARKKPDELKVLKEGDVTLYEIKGRDEKGKVRGKPGYAAFVDKNTLVATPSKAYTLQTVENAGKGAGRVGKDLQSALKKVSGKESVWWAVVVTDEMKKKLKGPQAEVLTKIESVTGNVNLSDTAKLSVLVNTADEKSADQLKETIDEFKPFLQLMAQNNKQAGPAIKDVLDNLKISAEKNSVRISLEVTEEALRKAAAGGKRSSREDQ